MSEIINVINMQPSHKSLIPTSGQAAKTDSLLSHWGHFFNYLTFIILENFMVSFTSNVYVPIILSKYIVQH